MKNLTPVRSGLLAGLILGFLLLSGCASDRQVIAQAHDVHGEIKAAVFEDEVLNNYMQQLGDRILEVAREMSRQGLGPRSHFRGGDPSWMFGEDIKFHLVNSDTLNAFTTGGKHMYMYSELFRQCRTEDEFAAVMAHEFAHIYARHVHRGMDRQYAILGATLAAGAAGYALGGDNREQWAAGAAGLAFVGGQFVGMGFSRKDEDEADKWGFQFYVRAGWDPERFADFFQAMIDKGYDTTPDVVSTHPSLRSRVENARRRVAELPPEAKHWRRPNVASPQRFKELQDRAARLGKKMPNDESLARARLMLAAFPSCVAPVAQPQQKQARLELLYEMDEQSGQQTSAR